MIGNGHLDFSGGELGTLTIHNNATATFSGGKTIEIYSYQTAWKLTGDPPVSVPNPHIEIICKAGYNYNPTSKILTGTWGNDSLFNIQLVNVTGYSPAIDNIKFTIIPEPASLLLLSLGGLLLRERKGRQAH